MCYVYHKRCPIISLWLQNFVLLSTYIRLLLCIFRLAVLDHRIFIIFNYSNFQYSNYPFQSWAFASLKTTITFNRNYRVLESIWLLLILLLLGKCFRWTNVYVYGTAIPATFQCWITKFVQVRTMPKNRSAFRTVSEEVSASDFPKGWRGQVSGNGCGTRC